MIKKKIIPYSRQYISKHEINSVTEVLKSDFLTQGPKVPLFEKLVSKFVGSKYSAAINSATSGLHLACMAIGLKKGDWLWTSTNSFVASANCGLYCGANVDLIDIDIESHNISIPKLKDKLIKAKKAKKLPKVLIPVHFAGRPCEMKEIYKLSKKYNFKIIEDASHALGSKIYGEMVGNCKYSDMCVFSFHPVKNITTGEGGIVSTNSKFYIEKVKILRTHGINKDKKYFINKIRKKDSWHYEQVSLGFNYRMNDIEAAIGISQLEKLNNFLKIRNKIAKNYNDELKNLPLILPLSDNKILNAYHLYVIRVNKNETSKNREELFRYMRKKNLHVNVHYIPIHHHPYYVKKGFKKSNFPVAENYFETCISIPIYPGLKKKDFRKVVKTIKIFFNFNEK